MLPLNAYFPGHHTPAHQCAYAWCLPSSRRAYRVQHLILLSARQPGQLNLIMPHAEEPRSTPNVQATLTRTTPALTLAQRDHLCRHLAAADPLRRRPRCRSPPPLPLAPARPPRPPPPRRRPARRPTPAAPWWSPWWSARRRPGTQSRSAACPHPRLRANMRQMLHAHGMLFNGRHA